jgi:hypothetical protein
LRSFDSEFGIFDSGHEENDSATPFAAEQPILKQHDVPATQNKLRSFDSKLLATDSLFDISDSAKRRLRRSAGPSTINVAKEQEDGQ